jgi:hypothetical protein
MLATARIVGRRRRDPWHPRLAYAIAVMGGLRPGGFDQDLAFGDAFDGRRSR